MSLEKRMMWVIVAGFLLFGFGVAVAVVIVGQACSAHLGEFPSFSACMSENLFGTR